MAKCRPLWRYLDDFPPVLVRLMGRASRGMGARGLTSEEVARDSALALDRVLALEQMTSWRGIDLIEAEAFCRGCRFDPTNAHDRREKSYKYLLTCKQTNRTPWWYLRNSPQWPKYQQLIKLYSQSRSFLPT